MKTVENLMVKSRCRVLMPKKSTYILRIDHYRSKSVEKCSLYIIVEYSHDAVSNLCLLGFHFQNLPFSKSASKNVPFSCEREAYPSHFDRLKNFPASCESSLNLKGFHHYFHQVFEN